MDDADAAKACSGATLKCDAKLPSGKSTRARLGIAKPPEGYPLLFVAANGEARAVAVEEYAVVDGQTATPDHRRLAKHVAGGAPPAATPSPRISKPKDAAAAAKAAKAQAARDKAEARAEREREARAKMEADAEEHIPQTVDMSDDGDASWHVDDGDGDDEDDDDEDDDEDGTRMI
ncbi:hypothetical protein JL720_10083 [Aureococcus anophagefferens]|nr:hypothetical protein JL720_10083 [Aureococcus anophagefferens]